VSESSSVASPKIWGGKKLGGQNIWFFGV